MELLNIFALLIVLTAVILVVFSILVQGLTLPRLVRRILPAGAAS